MTVGIKFTLFSVNRPFP